MPRGRRSQGIFSESVLWYTLPWQICAPGRTYHHKYTLTYRGWLKGWLGDTLPTVKSLFLQGWVGQSQERRIPWPGCILYVSCSLVSLSSLWASVSGLCRHQFTSNERRLWRSLRVCLVREFGLSLLQSRSSWRLRNRKSNRREMKQDACAERHRPLHMT